jgi:hypothetical protein
MLFGLIVHLKFQHLLSIQNLKNLTLMRRKYFFDQQMDFLKNIFVSFTKKNFVYSYFNTFVGFNSQVIFQCSLEEIISFLATNCNIINLNHNQEWKLSVLLRRPRVIFRKPFLQHLNLLKYCYLLFFVANVERK